MVVETEHRVPMAHQGYIEPHACTATVNEDGKATDLVLHPGSLRRSFADRGRCWARSIGNIKVIPSEIGGGFGGKTTIYLEPLAVKMSQMTGRPVKMIDEPRGRLPCHGPDLRVLGARPRSVPRRMGRSRRQRLGSRMKPVPFPGPPSVPDACPSSAPYEVPNLVIEGNDVLVNKPKVCAYRAPGAPQSMHAMECAIDELARQARHGPHRPAHEERGSRGHAWRRTGRRFPAIGSEASAWKAAKVHPNYVKPRSGRRRAAAWPSGSGSTSACSRAQRCASRKTAWSP